jgi:Phage DNA packaging protein Nu1
MAIRFGDGTQLARELGCSKQAVSQAEKAGRITRCANGKFDLDAAKVQWERNTDRDQQRRAMGQQSRQSETSIEVEAGVSNDWRRRRDAAEAKLAELELEEREGRLCQAAEVHRIIGRFLAAMRTQLEAIPDRISAEFGVDDASRRKLRQRLRDELAQIRTELVIAGRSQDQ